jgi:hypothetical protein
MDMVRRIAAASWTDVPPNFITTMEGRDVVWVDAVELQLSGSIMDTPSR